MLYVDNRHSKKKSTHKSTQLNKLITNTLTTIFYNNVDYVEKKPIIL